MVVSIEKAKQFVFGNGTLWEKALFSYLFEDGSLERVHQCLLCYKNEDNGFGHGLEFDMKCPASNPLQIEFLLNIGRDTGVPLSGILDGTVQWVENNRNEDGSLKNPDNLLDYPHAPWWSGGGQTAPDSIVGNLVKLGLCSVDLFNSTKIWVKENLTVEKIKDTEWLFMNYHAFDYFMNLTEEEEFSGHREATIKQIIQCAENAPEKQYFTFFQFASTPDSPVAQAATAEMLEKFLNYLEVTQQEDGGWEDEHGLAYWRPYFTIVILHVLRNYGKLSR
jgi:hypothetical protein